MYYYSFARETDFMAMTKEKLAAYSKKMKNKKDQYGYPKASKKTT